MKSFSDYLSEAYSFRLGGSQRKGFDAISFNTLKNRDFFYMVYNDDEDFISACIVGGHWWNDEKEGFLSLVKNKFELNQQSLTLESGVYVTISLNDAIEKYESIFRHEPRMIMVENNQEHEQGIRLISIDDFKKENGL